MIIDEDVYLAHYGTPRHSGRYPWGSGGNVDQSPRSMSFHDHVNSLRKQGLKDTEIAKGMGISTTRLRARITISRAEKAQAETAMAVRLKEKGLSNGAIADRMGLPGESSVRGLLAGDAKNKADALLATSNMLREQIKTKKYVDIGVGVENYLNVSQTRLAAAVAILQEEGYPVHLVKEPQLGTAFETRRKVLALPGTTWGEVQKNKDKIRLPTSVSEDNGVTFSSGKIHPPISINQNRVAIKYANDGGAKEDGVIYVRPGIEELSLGQKRYAQVRIQVGEGHYLKGMAMYKDDLPPGTDLLFNTSKDSTGNKLDAMKKMVDDPDLPFESVVRQIIADPGTPHERVTSAMNIVNEEGDWATWSKTISAQVLSKQPPTLAKEQLDKTYDRRKKEFDEISSLTNPTVKKKLLEDFAGDADAAAVHLKAAQLPRQGWHAILPINTMPPTQIFAPGFRDGEVVVLIRYPHGGTFEIPELTVNNKHPDARKLLGTDSVDVVGIHHSVAEHLSGADFDGDTVLVIPNNSGKIRKTPALDGLKNFNPKVQYRLPDDAPELTEDRKQQLMGDVSNLITDMTIKGAPASQLVRAVRHSMVVIDAKKWHLDHKQSAIDNGIAALKAEYQGRTNAGAATIISRKKHEDRILERKPRPHKEGGPVNRVTGRLEFVPTNRMRKTQDGVLVPRRQVVKSLAETPNAHTLVSPARTPMERLYADHSNRLKALANEARLAALHTPSLRYSRSAKQVYGKEAITLASKLRVAKSNAPLERQAQGIANAVVKAKREANPNLDGDTLKKVKFQALEDARNRMGANKKERQIEITPKEWDAIQAGAISNNMLKEILTNTDLETVKKFATPRRELKMTTQKTALAKRLLAGGATRAEVADRLGVSLTTLDVATHG